MKNYVNGEVQRLMTIDYVDYHRHLEECLAQLGREIPGPHGIETTRHLSASRR